MRVYYELAAKKNSEVQKKNFFNDTKLEKGMATWGSHFRIAEIILKKYDKLNRKCFAIGNIGPDCCLPNKNWSAFTPSRDVSHFTITKVSNWLETNTFRFMINDLKFFSKYLIDFNLISPQDNRSFLLGYFLHLITDNLWNYYIMKPLKEEYFREFQKNPDFIWVVKKDWYDLDKIYITENKDSLFWTDFLEAEYNEDFINFLPREGVQRQLEYIKKLYQISEEEYIRILKRKYVYLEKTEMDQFVQNSSNVILKVLTRILEKKFKFTGKSSVLDDIIVWN